MNMFDNSESLVVDGDENGGSIFQYFERLRPLSGEEMAKMPIWGGEFKRVYAENNKEVYVIDCLGNQTTTRQHISQLIKRAMGKAYKAVKMEDPDMAPFAIAANLLLMFGVNHSDEKEVKKFFRLFPKDIKDAIVNDARKHIGCYVRKTTL
jgi:hypothetical protein